MLSQNLPLLPPLHPLPRRRVSVPLNLRQALPHRPCQHRTRIHIPRGTMAVLMAMWKAFERNSKAVI